jgi:hypothetical protein
MQYIAFAKARTGNQKERMARRARWEHPRGIKVLHEFWTVGGEVSAVFIAEADDPLAVMEAQAAWDDAFEIIIHPVVTAEQGLAAAQKLAGARA